MEQSTKPKFLIRDKAMKENTARREELIKEYLSRQIPDSRSQYCGYYLRGFCIFKDQECHYAHSVKSLEFKKPDLEEYLKKILSIDKEELMKKNIIDLDDDEKDKTAPKIREGLYIERSYDVLFEYQKLAMEKGDLNKLYTLEELNANRNNRQAVRDIFHRDLQQQFVTFLFKEYNKDTLPKNFVASCFKVIGWSSRFRKIVNSHFCYEFYDNTFGLMIKRLPVGNDFDELVFKSIITLFKRFDLHKNLPVPSSKIKDLYCTVLMKEDPTLPDIYWYVCHRSAVLDDLLEDMNVNAAFRQRVNQELGLEPVEDLKANPLFLHEKNENIRFRDQIVTQYLSDATPDMKSVLCRFYRRGLCIFDSKTCKFAHALEDLQFKPLNIENYDKGIGIKEKDEQIRIWKKKWADHLKTTQPSLNLEFSYQNLYDYQDTLIKEGYLTKKFELQELNADEETRAPIRWMANCSMIKQCIDFFFKYYNRKYLTKIFLDHCFHGIGWMTNWDRFIDDDFLYEVKVEGKGVYVGHVPPVEEFNLLMETSIIEIIKSNKLISNLPINPATITRFFYKDIVKKDPFAPNIHVFIKKTKTTLEDYAKSLNDKSSFKENLAKELGIELAQIEGKIIFDSNDIELYEFMLKMEKINQELIDKSHLGLIYYKKFEETVQKKCKKEIDLYNTNYAQIRKIMKGVILSSGMYLCNLGNEFYIFSPEKFLKADVNSFGSKYIQKLNQKCARKVSKTSTSEPVEVPYTDEAKEKNVEALSNEEIDSEIDINKILVVDSDETLADAMEKMKTVLDIGVDLEGNLNKNGMIDLVQISCGENILIFDVYKAGLISTELKEKMLAFIKKIMEDPKITKVFHDCRKDSLALHLFSQACPVRVFDVSAVHSLIRSIKLYSDVTKEGLIENFKFKTQAGEKLPDFKAYAEKVSDFLKEVEELRPPGLNEVLSTYGAEHGLNKLKDTFKKKFQEATRDFFTKRPLEKDFLVYSAKDVQDLVQVKGNIEKELGKTLESQFGKFDERKLTLLQSKASKAYSWYGCFNLEN